MTGCGVLKTFPFLSIASFTGPNEENEVFGIQIGYSFFALMEAPKNWTNQSIVRSEYEIPRVMVKCYCQKIVALTFYCCNFGLFWTCALLIQA